MPDVSYMSIHDSSLNIRCLGDHFAKFLADCKNRHLSCRGNHVRRTTLPPLPAFVRTSSIPLILVSLHIDDISKRKEGLEDTMTDRDAISRIQRKEVCFYVR